MNDPAVQAAIRRNHPPQAGKDFTTVCYECERAVEAARSIHYAYAARKALEASAAGKLCDLAEFGDCICTDGH